VAAAMARAPRPEARALSGAMVEGDEGPPHRRRGSRRFEARGLSRRALARRARDRPDPRLGDQPRGGAVMIVQLERLCGREVLDAEGNHAGRLCEVHGKEEGKDLVITHYTL